MCSVSTVLYAQLKCTWHTESIKKPQHLAPNGQAFNVAPLRMLNFTSCASSTILQIVGNYDGSMKARVAFTQNQREVLHLQQPAQGNVFIQYAPESDQSTACRYLNVQVGTKSSPVLL
jgi:hypothetical protein